MKESICWWWWHVFSYCKIHVSSFTMVFRLLLALCYLLCYFSQSPLLLGGYVSQFAPICWWWAILEVVTSLSCHRLCFILCHRCLLLGRVIPRFAVAAEECFVVVVCQQHLVAVSALKMCHLLVPQMAETWVLVVTIYTIQSYSWITQVNKTHTKCLVSQYKIAKYRKAKTYTSEKRMHVKSLGVSQH